MKQRIKLISNGTGYGYVSFFVGKEIYSYQGIDGPVLNRIIAIAKRTPGKALDIAKKNSNEVRKKGETWRDNESKQPRGSIL